MRVGSSSIAADLLGLLKPVPKAKKPQSGQAIVSSSGDSFAASPQFLVDQQYEAMKKVMMAKYPYNPLPGKPLVQDNEIFWTPGERYSLGYVGGKLVTIEVFEGGSGLSSNLGTKEMREKGAGAGERCNQYDDMVDAARWSFSDREHAEVGFRGWIISNLIMVDKGDAYPLNKANQEGWESSTGYSFNLESEMKALGIDPTRPFKFAGKTFQYNDGKILIVDAGTGPSGLYAPLPGEGWGLPQWKHRS